MNFKRLAAALALLLAPAAFVRSQDPPSPVAPNALIEIRADQPARPISRLLNGACIEDVNHEIYGGLYSQMIYGESFQEPDALAGRLKGFQVLGGTWRVRGDELHFSGNHGDKIVSDLPKFATGEVTVEVFAPYRTLVSAGLIVHVVDAKTGADNFDG